LSFKSGGFSFAEIVLADKNSIAMGRKVLRMRPLDQSPVSSGASVSDEQESDRPHVTQRLGFAGDQTVARSRQRRVRSQSHHQRPRAPVCDSERDFTESQAPLNDTFAGARRLRRAASPSPGEVTIFEDSDGSSGETSSSQLRGNS
jgi:hypothetical protein